MPTADQILRDLAAIANGWPALAIFWHVYFLVLAALIAFGPQLPTRLCGVLLCLPLGSVSALAWMAGNPFNGAVIGALGLVLFFVSITALNGKASVSTDWKLGAGIALSGFGLVYPHFTSTESLIDYLYSAPTGLIPCPTLSILVGLSLVLRRLDSRGWSLTLGCAGLFYGILGAVYMDVALDWVLVAGALALVLSALDNGLQVSRS